MCVSDAAPFKRYFKFFCVFQMLIHLKDISVFLFAFRMLLHLKDISIFLFAFQMLLHLKDFSQRMMSRTHEIEKQVDTLMHETKV